MIDYNRGIKYLQERNYTLVSSNLVDAAIDAFDISVTYPKNAIVKRGDKTYMSRTDGNIGNEPFINPLFWRRIGTINTEAWRDDSFFTQSVAADEIVFVIDAPSAESIAFANLEATEIVIEQILDDDTVVNTITRDLATVLGSDWIAYWFLDPIWKRKIHIDIPLTLADRLRVTIKNPGSIAKVGNMQLGVMGEIGCETYGTTTEHRLVKSPTGEAKTITDVDIDTRVYSDDRMMIANRLSRLKDKFTFYFFGKNRKEVVCAKLDTISTTHEDYEESSLRINMKGINDDQ